MIKLCSQFMTFVIVGTGMIFNASFAYEIDEISNKEISHLITYIGNTDCIFMRNGQEYNATIAKMFIEYKYDIFRDEINSTEDFIKTAATKSQSTGIQYKTRCNGNEITSALWLSKELASYRNIPGMN